MGKHPPFKSKNENLEFRPNERPNEMISTANGVLFRQGTTYLEPDSLKWQGRYPAKVAYQPLGPVPFHDPSLQVADHPPGVGIGFRDDKPPGLGKGVVEVVDHPLDHVPVIDHPCVYRMNPATCFGRFRPPPLMVER